MCVCVHVQVYGPLVTTLTGNTKLPKKLARCYNVPRLQHIIWGLFQYSQKTFEGLYGHGTVLLRGNGYFRRYLSIHLE